MLRLMRMSRHRTCTIVGAVVTGEAGHDVGMMFGLRGGLVDIVVNKTKADHRRANTTTLIDILIASHAPQYIDYLSLSLGSSSAETDALLPVLVGSRYVLRTLTLTAQPDARLSARLAQHGYSRVERVLFGEQGTLYVHKSHKMDADARVQQPYVTVPMGVG